MADVHTWSTTAANNNSTPPDGMPEGQAPSTVNNSVRENMAAVRRQWNQAEWFEYGDGDGTYTASYVAATQFSIDGVDVSSVYHIGRRVRVIAPTPGTIYGTITAVAFSTNTTVTVNWDSGSLSSEAITSVEIGIVSKVNSAVNTTEISDADADTYWRVEQSADEDVVRGGTGGTERYVLDANGQRLPTQPSFLAYNSTAQSNLAPNASHDVQFDTEIFDRNADFDTGTYTFAAPVTGIYQFNAVVRISDLDNLTDFITINLVTSNRTYGGTRLDPRGLSSDPAAAPLAISVLADMDAADTAKIQLQLGANGGLIADIAASTAATMTSHFSGYLVA